MKRLKNTEHDQLPIDELLPEAELTTPHPVKTLLKKEPLYRRRKNLPRGQSREAYH
ncbi:hypothetical protein ACKFKF_30795 [Phormidesmis sp. 146-12]